MDRQDLIRKVKNVISSNALLFGTVTGAAFGFILGLFLKSFPKNDVLTSLVAYPGEIFMRALQLLIIPVIIFSLISGSCTLNIRTNGKIALRTFFYFLITSLCNAAFGTFLAVTIHPGDSSIKTSLETVRLVDIEDRKNTLLDNFLDLGRNVIPNNVFTSFFEMATTVYIEKPNGEFVKSLDSRKGVNAIGLIFYSLLFGTVMSLLEDKAKPLRDVVRAVDDVNVKTVSGLIWLTPFGVASLICAKVLEVEDMGKIMSSLLVFIMTATIGILLYQLIIMQLLYFLFLRKNPYKFYTGVLPAAVTGFAADSSSAALPVTLKCLDELKVDVRISRFVVPIGVICNMDGTALFISIASIFIAQMNNIGLGIGDYITICVTATAVSIAAASAPSASLTLMPLVLNAIGAPVQDIGLLFAIDWLCDRIRTTNNVLGDCYASAIVEHWSQRELNTDVTGENCNHAERDDEEKIEMSNVEADLPKLTSS